MSFSTIRIVRPVISKTVSRLALGACVAAITALPAAAQPLVVQADHFQNGGMIPAKYASCVLASEGHMGQGANISPGISWSAGPPGTKSYAVILTDTDVPAEHRDMANKPGETLTAAVARKTFYHWVLVDIPADVTSIAEGSATQGTPGLNDFTAASAKNGTATGRHFGYHGPCPPWNDEIVHHYHFTVYALSVARLDLGAAFNGPEALAAMKGEILAQGQELGLYTTNPAMGAKIQN